MRDDLVHLFPQYRVGRVGSYLLLQQLINVRLAQKQDHLFVVSWKKGAGGKKINSTLKRFLISVKRILISISFKGSSASIQNIHQALLVEIVLDFRLFQWRVCSAFRLCQWRLCSAFRLFQWRLWSAFRLHEWRCVLLLGCVSGDCVLLLDSAGGDCVLF